MTSLPQCFLGLNKGGVNEIHVYYVQYESKE